MVKVVIKPKLKVINEIYAPKFGESLVDIFEITGKNIGFSKYSLERNKIRYLSKIRKICLGR